jgi:hypothetical protein
MPHRSPTSVVARGLVATKAEREAREAALEKLPVWRVRKRAELRASISRIRSREQTLLSELGGRPPDR